MRPVLCTYFLQRRSDMVIYSRERLQLSLVIPSRGSASGSRGQHTSPRSSHTSDVAAAVGLGRLRVSDIPLI
eukprot:5677651-Prymnesium_polylepis.1